MITAFKDIFGLICNTFTLQFFIIITSLAATLLLEMESTVFFSMIPHMFILAMVICKSPHASCILFGIFTLLKTAKVIYFCCFNESIGETYASFLCLLQPHLAFSISGYSALCFAIMVALNDFLFAASFKLLVCALPTWPPHL